MTQGSLPRNHLPEKLVMGVRGAAVRHIIMSDRAMLATNRLIPGNTVQHSRSGRSYSANIPDNAHKVSSVTSIFSLWSVVFNVYLQSLIDLEGELGLCEYWGSCKVNIIISLVSPYYSAHLITVMTMKRLPTVPMMDTRPYRTRNVI